MDAPSTRSDFHAGDMGEHDYRLSLVSLVY